MWKVNVGRGAKRQKDMVHLGKSDVFEARTWVSVAGCRR